MEFTPARRQHFSLAHEFAMTQPLLGWLLFAGEYGCTHALRRGHGLSVFDSKGSGKAACIVQGNVSAAAGFFVEGRLEYTCSGAQLCRMHYTMQSLFWDVSS